MLQDVLCVDVTKGIMGRELLCQSEYSELIASEYSQKMIPSFTMGEHNYGGLPFHSYGDLTQKFCNSDSQISNTIV